MADVSEVPEEQSPKGLDVQRYLNLARRRHMHFLIPVLIGWLTVWGVSWMLPVSYKSSTLILVERPTMPKNYVEPNVNEDLQDRLQSITQQILSRTRLLLIIDKLHLYDGGRKPVTPEDKVNRMRKDIGVDLVHDAHNEEITAFRISYRAHDPHVAQQITSELADLFINESLKVRQQESEDTTKFIENQLENARASLAEQESAVREFEGKHEGELPAQQATNLQILSGLQTQLQNEQDASNNAKQQGIYFDSLIQQYRALRSTPRTAEGGPSDLPAIDKELESLRSKLANLSAHYTDRYPDVQNLRVEIAKTEKMRDDLQASLKNKSKAVKQPDDGITSGDSGNITQNSPLLQLESQLRANQAEVKNREQAVAGLKLKVSEYQARLNNEPASEQQLADLTRGYEQSKVNYDDLLKKKNASEMATSMEQMQQGEHFRVLDSPSLPLKPDFPDRLKMCGVGLGVGLVFGLVVVGSFEALDDRLYSDNGTKELLPVPIISEIPVVLIPSEERGYKEKRMLGWAMAALVTATILAGSVFSYLHE
jgi:polysaccharide chain length determinant protein (PEP-CTERM system associated)